MYRPTTCLLVILLAELCSGYFYSPQYQQQIEEPLYGGGGGGGAYQFSYEAGSPQQTEYAHSFREESRDEYGNVVGKYGYVDPNGQLRVVKYRAGADGYYADGDTGVDQETLRQQRLLYSGDEATQIQQQTWQQYGGAGSPGGAYGGSSSSAAASAASAASASSSSSSQYYTGQSHQGGSDWTSATDGGQSTINQQYNVKGGQQRFVERLIAPAPVKAPVQLQYQTTSSQYNLPVVRQYSSTTYHTVPGAVQYPTAARYSTKTTGYSGALKTSPARYTQTSVYKPIVSQQQSAYHSASSASAAASAAASASSSSYAGGAPSGAYFYSGGTKGGATKGSNAYRSARYSNAPAHAKVQFKQFGIQPFQYSYSF